MGIHGVFKDIGSGQRISLAKLSCDHYTKHGRPFRLAIDISIWLFQIQSGKGGSNPALRTFYYRLLRLITLNIHPLFVFDGPKKPLFKRNKKVGGPGVRVASVPEFLAKQLLKQFGFPWHVAPGEAEAECALLQREGIVDAVLSEDVDTLMFGSGVTLRNWTPEGGSGKTPTHVNVYRAEETLSGSGMDGQGMVLVALMSGGDYIPEGIPGCGPKLACDAARAGFGKDLCALRRSDKEGLKRWRERLQHEIRTNESRLFSRKNTKLVIPDDFPSAEVFGYYTRPCISTSQKLDQLRDSLKWDQNIDFPALRCFTADAFDWRCIGGAKKFIRNLAPAMLVRRLRMIAEDGEELEQEAQAEAEAALVTKIHGKRTHKDTDGSLELRISFTPSNLVPIDLGIEDEEDDFIPAGQDEDDSGAEEGIATVPSETPTDASEAEGEVPTSPTKKPRQAKPYDPDASEKLWMLKEFLQLGCPLLIEDYEASLRDPREAVKAKRKAKTTTGTTNIHAAVSKPGAAAAVRKPRATKAKATGMPANALMRHMQVSKAASTEPEVSVNKVGIDAAESDDELPAISAFRLPTTRVPSAMMRNTAQSAQPVDNFFLASTQPVKAIAKQKTKEVQRTPKKSNARKRPSPDFSTPRAGRGRGDITAYFSPTPKANRTQSQGALDAGVQVAKQSAVEIVDLLSSSPMQDAPRDPSPSPLRAIGGQVDGQQEEEDALPALPETVTKRRKIRRERRPLRKILSAPVGMTSPLFMPMQDLSPDPPFSFQPQQAKQDDEHQRHPSPSPTPRILHRGASDLQSRPAQGLDLPSSQRSLPTPPAETSSPYLKSVDELFGRGKRTAGARRLATPPPTANLANASRPNVKAKQAEPITLSSSPPAPDPQSAHIAPANPPARRMPAPPPSAQLMRDLAPLPAPEPRTGQIKSKAKAKPKTHILLRPSLPGTWKAATDEEAEALDLTGDGSGVRKDSGSSKNGRKADGKASRTVWRRSGVEVLDLTGG